jgi:hypothetical protein
MRLRLAAIVLAAAACGLVAPGFADDEKPAKTDAAPAADLAKYLPEGSGYYVHINVRRFLGAPVIRKAIPMAVDKFDKQIMMGVQMAAAFAPGGGANMPNEEQMKQGLDTLKDPKVIANAFDAAKEFVTDVVVGGVPGDEGDFVMVVKCHEAATPEIVKQFAPMFQGNPQIPVKLKMHEKGEATIYEFEGPNQPQPMFFTLPKAGVVCFSMTKKLMEKAAAGAKNKLPEDLQKLVAERKKTDFLFVAMTPKGEDKAGVVSGWGRLVLDKDVSGEMAAKFTNAEKAAEHAKEANEHFAQMANAVKGMLGPQAKEVAPILDKMKAVADGDAVSAKFTIPGDVVEKLLKKEKEKDKEKK